MSSLTHALPKQIARLIDQSGIILRKFESLKSIENRVL